MFYVVGETVLVSHSRKLSRTATFAPWGRLDSLLPKIMSTIRSTGIPAVLR